MNQARTPPPHLRFDSFSKAFPRCLTLLSYRSSSSRLVNVWNVSGSKRVITFCRRHSRLRCFANLCRRKLASEPIRKCTSSKSCKTPLADHMALRRYTTYISLVREVDEEVVITFFILLLSACRFFVRLCRCCVSGGHGELYPSA
jgi:hypothetical protein